jgi:hypothetical protein
MGRAGGLCGGKGGTWHMTDPSLGFQSTSAMVGGSIGLSVGGAFALKHAGKGNVAVALFGLALGLSLNGKTAIDIHFLRREPDMTHHGNSNLDKSSNRIQKIARAFHLHALRATFLHETNRIENRVFRRNLKGSERHVGHNHGFAASASDTAGQEKHRIHRHGDCRRVSCNHIPC